MSTYYNYVVIILFVCNQLDQVPKTCRKKIQPEYIELDLVLKLKKTQWFLS